MCNTGFFATKIHNGGKCMITVEGRLPRTSLISCMIDRSWLYFLIGVSLKRDRENATRTRKERILFPCDTGSDKAKAINRRLCVLFLLPRRRRRSRRRFLAVAGLTRRHLAHRLIASKYSLHGAPNV